MMMVEEEEKEEEDDDDDLWREANWDVKCWMFASMNPELQKRFINSDAYQIILELKNMFQEQARNERFETQRLILETKIKKGEPVSEHVLKIIGLFENMRALDSDVFNEMVIDIILH
ncbi:uncharacterized protein [Spinacia oleracea]|uniref:Retrotransposon gag domain-containing protein n=1 Tax=Spinacia oleracea TaxID=3562 RepID=A0ABM3RPE8_SPIOL|nr:uncharacterized protein LOC130471411 [Spinacia oleracea]